MKTLRAWLAAKAVMILAAVLVVVSSLLLVQTVRIDGFHIGPIGVKGLAQRVEECRGHQDRLTTEQDRRAAENAQNDQSYANLQRTCTDRVIHTREVVRTITEMTDENNPNRPRVIGADQLRDIFGQPPVSSDGLPAGDDGGGGDRATRTR